MPLIAFLIALACLFVVLWLVTAYLAPRLPAPLGTAAIVVTVILIIAWLLSASGIWPGIAAVRVG